MENIKSEKIWHSNYEEGIPTEINLAEYKSLGDMIEQSVKRFSQIPAFVSMGTELSYDTINTLSNQFASYLQNVLGLPRGSRVALMMPNILQYPICMFGALKAGYVVVNCNPLYTSRELQFQLANSGATAIVIVENFAHVLESVLRKTAVKHVVVTSIGDLLGFPKGALVNFVLRKIKKMVPAYDLPTKVNFLSAMKQGSLADFRPVEVNQEDTAFLQYTGGTTGVSKGAMLTHRNILANVLQAHAWIKPHCKEGEELVITALPLYHIFALTANCFCYFRFGSKNILIINPKDLTGFIKEISKYPFTAITGVNTLFNALLNHKDFSKLDFSCLKISLGGGMAVQKSVADKWQSVTGVPLIEAYGLTETSPAATINPLNLKEYNGSIGLPLPSTEIVIRNEDGQDCPIGETGELCVRGPQVMKGYYNRPDETAIVMMDDGFLRTGDIAVMDSKGFFKIVDRKKDMILVSGFNVYPNEIEDVAAMHPGVLEVAAVGVPHPKAGEAVKLFVVKKDPTLTSDEIISHCRTGLVSYKIPHTIEFRESLPKTNVGKILRRELRN